MLVSYTSLSSTPPLFVCVEVKILTSPKLTPLPPCAWSCLTMWVRFGGRRGNSVTRAHRARARTHLICMFSQTRARERENTRTLFHRSMGADPEEFL